MRKAKQMNTAKSDVGKKQWNKKVLWKDDTKKKKKKKQTNGVQTRAEDKKLHEKMKTNVRA